MRDLNSLLRESEFNTLATYNSEVARGIVHTEEWKTKMAGYQARYIEDELRRVTADAEARGATVEKTENGYFVIPKPRRRWWHR